MMTGQQPAGAAGHVGLFDNSKFKLAAYCLHLRILLAFNLFTA